MKTLTADVIITSPLTKIMKKPQITGSHTQCLLTVYPNTSVVMSKSAIWMTRCKQLLSTDATGMISRGIATRLTNAVPSTIACVPEPHAKLKKLNGTSPQSTKTGNDGWGLGKIFVKTNVNTLMVTSGFSRDQNTPKDMLR